MNVLSFGKKAENRVRYRANEAISYFYNIAKPMSRDKVRLLIFGQGRSGSTLLESLICSTGYFSENGELLNTSKGEILYPIQYIRGLSNRNASENFIFHLKVYQLTRDRKRPIDPADFLNALYNDGWKIIYLQRENKVKHALSNVVAEHRGDYHKFNEKNESFSVSIDCNNFVEKVKERYIFEDDERFAMANIKYHKVIYEDDLEKPHAHQSTINRILDYVSLEHRKATTKYRKVNTQSLRSLVANYDDFVDCLTKQGWQGFL